MLRWVGEFGAVTTKMLSHGPSHREVCGASGQQPPVAETVTTNTTWKKKISLSQNQLREKLI